MGKATETLNNFGMPSCIVQRFGVPVCLEKGDAFLLVRPAFAMHVRKVEEAAFDEGQRSIEAFCKGLLGRCSRLPIRGEGAGRVTEEVAWKLVEEEDEGKRALGRLREPVTLAGGGQFNIVKETFADFPIEARVRLVPQFPCRRLAGGVLLGEPEIKDLFDPLARFHLASFGPLEDAI